MKRAFTFDYSSDEEEDAWLARILDDFERQLRTNTDADWSDSDDDTDEDDWLDDSEDDQRLAQAMEDLDQRGGALPGGPLFAFEFTPIGQRRRWRNVVRGQSFNATLQQLRDARPTDNVGEALTEALRVAINRELRTLDARPHDRVNFSMTAHGFPQAFQSVNFAVREFIERSLRLDTLLQSLADKLNSNEEFNPQRGFEVMLSVIAMPTPGSGKRKHNPGRRCLEKVLHNKRAIITIKNQDDLCCARAIVTMRAHCHREQDGEAKALWDTMRKGRPRQTMLARELHQLANVPEGPCGVDELHKFQDALGDQYQLLVMCMAKPFLLIFKGPPAPNTICILKGDGHYNGCTSFGGFLNRGFYCSVCEKGYNTEDAAPIIRVRGGFVKVVIGRRAPTIASAHSLPHVVPDATVCFSGQTVCCSINRGSRVGSFARARCASRCMASMPKNATSVGWPSVLLAKSLCRSLRTVALSNRWIRALLPPPRVNATTKRRKRRILCQPHCSCMRTLRLCNWPIGLSRPTCSVIAPVRKTRSTASAVLGACWSF